MHYPAFLDLKDQRCLVVGGGRVAEKKIGSLLEAGAEVVSIAEDFSKGILELEKRNAVRLETRKIRGGADLARDLENVFLVVAATTSCRLNAQIYDECRKRNLLVNVVDDPAHSNFITPSILRRGQLAIAVSTGGASPEFSKTVRQRLESSFGSEYGSFLEFMSRERKKIMRWVKDQNRRKKLFRDLVRSGLLDLFKKGDRRAIREKYESILLKHGIPKGRLR